MKRLTSFITFIIIIMLLSNVAYASDHFVVLQENGVPYDFLCRRTKAQLDELYRLYDTGEYSYVFYPKNHK